MGTLKINWWIASITAILLLFGAFVVVKAVEKSETKATKTEATAPAERPVVMDIWHFIGDDPREETDYSLDGDNLCPGAPETICTIEAENVGGLPNLGPQQLADIQEVLDAIAANQTPQENATVKSFREL